MKKKHKEIFLTIIGWANEVSDILLLRGENIKGYKCWFVWVSADLVKGKNRFKSCVHLKY